MISTWHKNSSYFVFLKQYFIHNIHLFIILLISALLLFWRLGSGMVFIGDFAWYFLHARDFLLGGDFPLVGIPSSVPIIRQGAIWTWILAIALKLGNFNPVSGAFAASLINLLGIFFSYKITKEIFNKNVAILTSLFLATSPLVVIHSRLPFQTALILPASLLMVWFYFKAETTRRKLYLFILGLSLSLILQIYLGAFILFPVVLFSIIISWKKYTFKNLLYILGGIIFGIIPFIVWDISQGVCIQTLGFLAWFFTKIFELIPSLINGSGRMDFKGLVNILKSFYIPAFFIGSISLFLVSGIKFIIDAKNNKNSSIKIFIFLWLLLGLFGLVGRGQIIEAYLPLLFYPLALILSLFLESMILKSKWFVLLSVLVSVINIWYLTVKDPLFTSRYKSTYLQDLNIASDMAADANGNEFQFKYITKGPYFESNDDHYEYILWWKGGHKVYKSDLKYQLTSNFNILSPGFNVIRKYDDLVLIKK